MAKGALPAELVAAGLLIAPEDGGAPYDRFRDRIIFPIADGRGRVISFGGRAMDAVGAGKIPQRAGQRPLRQGAGAVRPGRGAQAAPRGPDVLRRWGRSGGRRGLYGRDRLPARGGGGGGGDGDIADRSPDGGAVAAASRADDLSGRRQRGRARRVARDRPRAAASRARQELRFRRADGGQGSGRHPARPGRCRAESASSA